MSNDIIGIWFKKYLNPWIKRTTWPNFSVNIFVLDGFFVYKYLSDNLENTMKYNKKRLYISFLFKYCKKNCLVLSVYRILILTINRYRSLIDNWHFTGLLLLQYWWLLLVEYWQVSYANLGHSTSLVLAVNPIQILAINRHRNLIDTWRSTGWLLPQNWLLLLVKYWQVSYGNLGHSTGSVLSVNRIQWLAINRHRNLIDSWHSTGLLLVQYWS